MDPLILATFFTSASLFSIFFGLRQLLGRKGGGPGPASRLQEIMPMAFESAAAAAEPAKKKMISPFALRLNRVIANADFANDLSLSLLRANMKMTVPEYVLINVAVVAVVALVALILSGNVLVGIAGGAVGFFLPGFYVKRKQGARFNAFQAQLSDVLTLLVGSLRAGYSLLHAMDVVSKEVPPPASEEFTRVVREIGLGLSLEQALDNMLRRVNSEDLDLVVSAVNIQHEVGGNLATILETIANTIRERIKIHGEIRVLTTQQKATGYILTFLPFVVGGVLFVINPTYMSALFTPGITLIIPFGAVVGIFIGFLVMRKIVNIEV